MSRTRLTDAGNDRVAGVPDSTCLVAQDTGTNTVGRSGHQLAGEQRICDLGPGHLDEVGLAVSDQLLGERDVDDRALRHEGDPGRQSGAHDRRRLAVETGLDMTVGPGGGGPEPRAAHGAQIIQAQGRQGGQQSCRGLRHDPCPGGALVTRKPEPDQSLGRDANDGIARYLDHACQELAPVGSELVAAEVRELRAELAQEAVLARVELHPVTARLDRGLRRDGKGGDHSLDLLPLHRLGDFSGLHVRHRGGPEQDALVMRARALAPRVAESGDHERTLLVAGM